MLSPHTTPPRHQTVTVGSVRVAAVVRPVFGVLVVPLNHPHSLLLLVIKSLPPPVYLTSSTYQYRTRLSTNSSCDGGSWRWSNWGTLASSIEYSVYHWLHPAPTPQPLTMFVFSGSITQGVMPSAPSRAVSGTPTGVTPCTGGTVSWTVSGNTCSGTRSETDSASSDTVSNTTSGTAGSATYSCTGTNWGSATNATCCKKSTLPTCTYCYSWKQAVYCYTCH